MASSIELQELNTAESFYNTLASEYDEMTGFLKRFIQEKPFFHLLVEKYHIRTALDAGCGTGFHALLLAQLGVRVTAFDSSTEMLLRAEQHASEMALTINFQKASFEHLIVGGQYDAVFCLGNTLPHLLSSEELRVALRNFASVLEPGKILFLQNLNYDRILAFKERVQSIKEVNGKTYIRFYDYNGENIMFNLLTLEKVEHTIEPRFQSVELRPLRRSELILLLKDAGFEDIKLYGGISMEEFHPESSRDLVVLARKAE